MLKKFIKDNKITKKNAQLLTDYTDYLIKGGVKVIEIDNTPFKFVAGKIYTFNEIVYLKDIECDQVLSYYIMNMGWSESPAITKGMSFMVKEVNDDFIRCITCGTGACISEGHVIFKMDAKRLAKLIVR